MEAVQEIRTKFDRLKAQYVALMKAVPSSKQEIVNATSPLPIMPEVEVIVKRAPTTRSVSASRRSRRNSIATTASESFVEWFDAEDEGPQEFIMDVGPEVPEPLSRLVPVDDDDSSVNTDIAKHDRLASPASEELLNQDKLQVVRRTELPFLSPGDEGSLFAILKKNIGKVSEMFLLGFFQKQIDISGSLYNNVSSYVQRTVDNASKSCGGS